MSLGSRAVEATYWKAWPMSANLTRKRLQRCLVGGVSFMIAACLNRKAARRAISDDPNVTNGLAAAPLPYGLKAFFAESP
jgi:hypothetical protein